MRKLYRNRNETVQTLNHTRRTGLALTNQSVVIVANIANTTSMVKGTITTPIILSGQSTRPNNHKKPKLHTLSGKVTAYNYGPEWLAKKQKEMRELWMRRNNRLLRQGLSMPRLGAFRLTDSNDLLHDSVLEEEEDLETNAAYHKR